IAELEVSEEEFLKINESIYFNQEGSRAFQEQFKPVIDSNTPIVVFRCVSHFGGVTEDDDLVEEEAIKVSEKKPLGNDVEDEVLENDEIVNIKESKKPKNVCEALKDERWVVAMQEELNQFTANGVWE
ncbi:hypothetical protein Tco_0768606, partial [Tanacetum coccineum]